MPEKIFISYNHKDEVLIDMIARRLELEFGRKNIFYDKWAIQPGDSIIGKMNEGLEEFTTFFFFVSPNSLESKMVSLEWQTALNKAVNNNLKFVAVRVADCSIPAILSDKVYIDVYGEGMDSAVGKMKCVVKSENVYAPLEDITNLEAEIIMYGDKKIEVVVFANMYSEQTPTLAFACDNNFDDFNIINHGLMTIGKDEIVLQDENVQLNAYVFTPIGINLRPGFPYRFVAESNSGFRGCCLFNLKELKTNQRIYEVIKVRKFEVRE